LVIRHNARVGRVEAANGAGAEGANGVALRTLLLLFGKWKCTRLDRNIKYEQIDKSVRKIMYLRGCISACKVPIRHTPHEIPQIQQCTGDSTLMSRQQDSQQKAAHGRLLCLALLTLHSEREQRVAHSRKKIPCSCVRGFRNQGYSLTTHTPLGKKR